MSAEMSSARCAPRADVRGDPMLGTAFPAGRLLLVEQPFPWGPEGLRTSHFDRETALALEARCRSDGIRVQAIRRLGRPLSDGPRRWCMVDTRRPTRSVIWGVYERDEDLLRQSFTGTPAAQAPIYLVCTHGRHDPCCGGRGHALAAALARQRPDQVWQSSHLGGCRFAPSVLVLPSGLMYGRVPSVAASELIDAVEANRILLPWLRGRIGQPPVAQAGLAYAHRRLGLSGVEDLTLISTRKASADQAIIHVESRFGRHVVTVNQVRVDATGLTCGAPEPSWFMSYRPVQITPIDT